MSEGWITLHRKIINNWLWENKPFSYGQAWIHLLLSANHKDRDIFFEGNVITIKRGSFLTSILKLSSIFGWDRKKTSRFLNLLENQKMITTNRTTHGTTIYIVNYGFFQDLMTTNGATNSTTDSTTDVQPFPTNNNDNNENNDNKKKEVRFIPPTISEVKNYCSEKGYKIDANHFIDFYEAKGWMIGKNKMKDWKAAIRTWAQRSNSKINKETENETDEQRGPASDFYKRYLV